MNPETIRSYFHKMRGITVSPRDSQHLCNCVDSYYLGLQDSGVYPTDITIMDLRPEARFRIFDRLHELTNTFDSKTTVYNFKDWANIRGIIICEGQARGMGSSMPCCDPRDPAGFV